MSALRRGGWSVRSQTRATMTCAADNFYVAAIRIDGDLWEVKAAAL